MAVRVSASVGSGHDPAGGTGLPVAWLHRAPAERRDDIRPTLLSADGRPCAPSLVAFETVASGGSPFTLPILGRPAAGDRFGHLGPDAARRGGDRPGNATGRAWTGRPPAALHRELVLAGPDGRGGTADRGEWGTPLTLGQPTADDVGRALSRVIPLPVQLAA